MMEGVKQTEDLFKTWTEAQTKMWNDWLKAMQGLGRPQSSRVWENTVDAWNQSIQKMLDTQKDWIQRWAENVMPGNSAPKEMVGWAKQGQEMLTRWIDTQKVLWASWFDIVKKLDPSEVGSWEREGQKFVQVWEDAIRRALDAQKEWTRRQTG